MKIELPNMHSPPKSLSPLLRRWPMAGALAYFVLTAAFSCPSTGRGAVLPAAAKVFFEKHCNECHDADTKKGDLDLTALSFDLSDPGRFEHWVRVYDRVRDGEMPPKKKARPGEADVRAFLDVLGKPMRTAEAARQAAEGRVRGRRLTRTEYENTLTDLLGVEIPLEESLPEDSHADGFDTVAATQDVSYYLLDKYAAAADLALDAAFRRALEPPMTWSVSLKGKQVARPFDNGDDSYREPERRGNDAVAWSTAIAYHGRMKPTRAPADGWYRIHIRAAAINPPKDGVVSASLRSGICHATAPALFWIGSLQVTVEPRDYVFEAWIRKDHILELRPNDATLPIANFKKVVDYDGRAEAAGTTGVIIQTVAVEHIERGLTPDQMRQRLFGDLTVSKGIVVSSSPKADIARLMKTFADRAYRRPADESDLRPYIGLAEAALDSGAPLAEALRAGYRSLLCSPRFLYFQEKAGRLDDYAVASRLSYLLWGTMPDDALRLAADQHRLGNAAELHAQVERMLNDPRAREFTEDFTAQWLSLRDIEATQPDPKLYPEFDPILQESMLGETHAFFDEVLKKDLSVRNFVQSDFAMLNSRIAKHYGIPGVTGGDFQRVTLRPNEHRGGLLGQASVLKVTANGTTTSPVLRGVWVLDRLLDQRVPPPPPNVPAIEPDIRGATTIREQLAKHRSIETCAACHAKIDPAGFALENFDVIGGWREAYRKSGTGGKKGSAHSDGKPVDCSYTMPDGTPFKNVDDFKQILLRQPDQVARCVTQKLAVYATGARVSFTDRQTIDAILVQTKPKNYGLRSILHAVVASELFLNK